MNTIDIILLIPVLWFAYKGFKNGLIKEIASLLAFILGLWAASKFYLTVGDLIQDNLNFNSEYLPIISFGGTFILIIILVSLISKLLTKVLEKLSLGIFNKIGGIIFSVLKASLILSAIIFFVNGLDAFIDFIPDELLQDSLLYKPIESIFDKIYPFIKNREISNLQDIAI